MIFKSVFFGVATIDKDKQIIIVNDKVITFEELDGYVKKYKNVNRINKPSILLLYTDYKNGHIHDWDFCKMDA